MKLDENKLKTIADNIERRLHQHDKSSLWIDENYKELILEYMRVVPKARIRELYYEEKDINISLITRKKKVSRKTICIKPTLPLDGETIAKRYTRPNENIAYKMMILDKLVNRFAHFLIDNNQKIELAEQLFKIKLKIIEEVIDLSNIDTNIKIYKMIDHKIDEDIMAIVIDIPGYAMISLHLKNLEPSLEHKFNNLSTFTDEILITPDIILPGVNDQLLSKLKKLSIEERIKTLINLDDTTFYKLAIRMGYTYETIKTQKDKRKFIRQMISDEKLDELIEQIQYLKETCMIEKDKIKGRR